MIINAQKNDEKLHKKLQMVRDGDETEFSMKDTEEKVQVIPERLKAANDRQKSYADLKRRDIAYEVGDKVFLKVSSWRKILQFGK